MLYFSTFQVFSMVSICVILFAFVLIFLLSFTFANWLDVSDKVYGHGLSRDESVPFDISGRQIVIEAMLQPPFLNEDNLEPRLLVRTYDQDSNETIKDIDYRIIGKFKNETIIDQRFHAEDGVISANIIPSNDTNTQYITNKDNQQIQLSKADLIEVSLTNPVNLKSKILSDGGLYEFKVILEKSSKGLDLDSDKNVDLFISIGRTYPFIISENQNNESNSNSNESDNTESLILKVKSYYDEITDFIYDKENSKISFRMPFTWNLDYVNQILTLHEELVVPKSHTELSKVSSFTGKLNNMEIPTNFILVDDFSDEIDRIVHIVVPGFKLKEYAQKIIKDGGNSTALFEIEPVKN